jgi:glycosyltransferase involved in cell wall biosynthesis
MQSTHGSRANPISSGGTSEQGRAPAVSVLVPCFNGGPFLDHLMASLDRQTFRDFEIIIIDDGSNDDETLRKLAALEGRVRVIRQENRGPSAARNTGIRAARGEFVAMLDCDDTYDPTYLAETVPLLRAAPRKVGMVFSHARVLGGQAIDSPRYFNRFDLLFTNTMSAGLVARKEYCLAVGGYDETMRDGYEDWDFSLRLADAGYVGLEVPKPLYNYYVRSEAIWMSRSSTVNVNRLHGSLWRSIRLKHAKDYRPLEILRLWWTSRDGTGRIPLWKGLAAYLLALLLPDAYFSQLIANMRSWMRAGARSESKRFRISKKPS